MTDPNLMGPALKLVHRYLDQVDVPDAEKLAFAGALMALVGDHQTELQQKLQSAVAVAHLRIFGTDPPEPGDEMPADFWGPEDDRLVVHAQIADIIDTMPIEQLERVLTEARRIRDEPNAPA